MIHARATRLPCTLTIVLSLGLPVMLQTAEKNVPQPTPEEVMVLLQVNAYRTDPRSFNIQFNAWTKLNKDGIPEQRIKSQQDAPDKPRQPVVFNPRLLAAAKALADSDCAPVAMQRTDPGSALTKAGYGSPGKAIAITAVDGPDPITAHRLAMLQQVEKREKGYPISASADLMQPYLREIGIGLNKSKANRWNVAEVLGIGQAKRLVGGVVFRDDNHNGVYDVNEGVGGVVVTCGDAKTVSGTAGSWTLELGATGAAEVTVAHDGMTEAFPIIAGADNVFITWIKPVVDDQKACDKQLSALAKETDETKSRILKANLLIASKRWKIDAGRQAKVSEAVKPIAEEWSTSVVQMREAMHSSASEFKSSMAAITKVWTGVPEVASWCKTAGKMYALQTTFLAWEGSPTAAGGKPILAEADKLIGSNLDREFLATLQYWRTSVDLFLAPRVWDVTKPKGK
jgi:hypothetical protein